MWKKVKGMFIGEYHYNLDDKNRIFIPNDFKNEIKALPLPAGVSVTSRDTYLNQF